jgi:lipopolysaccharide/colanic/teichoic acid biosynthesis glycosyltransferase
MSAIRRTHLVDQHRSSSLRLGIKRLLDIVIATILILVLLPVFTVAGVAVLVGTGRPLLFRQIRVGHNGRRFTMLKFRTMRVDAEQELDDLRDQNARTGPLFKASSDPRITSVGRVLRRLSVDELPQLFNVVSGQMSLVGPRPALPSEVEAFPIELRARESMPQGLTGLWQIEGRLDPDFEKYAELDLRYVEQWSVRLDLLILLKTPFVVAKQSLVRSEVIRARGDLFEQPTEKRARTLDFARGSRRRRNAEIMHSADQAMPLELAE